MIIVFLYDENNKYISKKVNVLKDKIIKEVKHKHCSLEKCYIHTNVLLENPDKYCYYIVFSNDIRDIDSYIKKCNASFLIMHGNRDKVADCKISRTFCEGMNRLGNKCNYYELDGAEHAFILSDYTSTDEQVDFYMKIIDDYIEKSI